MRVVVRVCSCLVRSLRALYIDLRCQSNVGVCSGERVVDVLMVGGGSIVFDRIATTCHPRRCFLYSCMNSLFADLDVFGFFVYSLADPTVV